MIVVKAIIFDCFGVLVGRGFKQTYAQAGGDPVKDKDFIADLLGAISLGHMTPQEMNQQITDKLGISLEVWQDVVAQAEQPNQELLAYIEQLKKNYQIAILSNANVGVMQRKFTARQLYLFDAVIVSAEVGMVKPDPQIYRYAAEQLDVELSACVFVDDNHGYCEIAISLGMKAICYRDFVQFKAELTPLLSQQ